MGTLILVIAILGVIIAYKLYDSQKNTAGEKKVATYKYKRRDYFMSRSEREFFNTLTDAVGNGYCVFPQVNLSTILDHEMKNGQSWKGARAHINRMSVDYVICDKPYLKPWLAIELDGSSHEREDRQLRDVEVDRIFADAGLPLLHFSRGDDLSKPAVAKRLSEKLSLYV